MAALVKLAPWLAIVVSLLAPTPQARVRRLGLAFVVLVAGGIFLSVSQWAALTRFPLEVVMAPIFLALFGWIVAIPALVLVVGTLSATRLRLLCLVGGLITLGALGLAFFWFVMASWASSAEQLAQVQLPVQLPLLGCAALGAVLAVQAHRAIPSAEP